MGSRGSGHDLVPVLCNTVTGCKRRLTSHTVAHDTMMDRSLLLYKQVPYSPAPWLSAAVKGDVPANRVLLGNLPTPLHRVQCRDIAQLSKYELYFKRDDLSSFDLSGNKVRKLEFLLCEALEKGHDSVITIGGLQSNHCRATAVAARQLGLKPHLILRTNDDSGAVNKDLTGNLLFNRLVDSHIYTVSSSNYAILGHSNLCHQLALQLQNQGKNPYVIPVGGSNRIGAFGYLSMTEELEMQTRQLSVMEGDVGKHPYFDHIVFACGSGGTLTGIALGNKLSGMCSKVHAICVCDSISYFRAHMQETAELLGVDMAALGPVDQWAELYSGAGAGYAKSTDEELNFLARFAGETGLLLDPVYGGKALYHFATKVLAEHCDAFLPGQRILFVHTGGTIGLYDKVDQLISGPMETSTCVEKLKLVKKV